MLRLLKAELFKLRKSKPFMVLCIIAVVIACINIVGTKLVSSESFLRASLPGMTEQQKDNYIKGMQTMPDNTDEKSSGNVRIGVHVNGKDMFHPTGRTVFYSSFGSGLIEILLAVLVGAMVAKEYSSGTIKNTLAYGKKRWQYYVSKVIGNTIGGTILLAIMVGIATIVGCILFGWGGLFTFNDFTSMSRTILGSIVMILTVSSLLVLVATLTKSNGGTIAIGIVVLVIAQPILAQIYSLRVIKWLDPIYKISISHNWATILNSSSTNGDIFKSVSIGIIMSVIASLAGVALIRKQDIK